MELYTWKILTSAGGGFVKYWTRMKKTVNMIRLYIVNSNTFKTCNLKNIQAKWQSICRAFVPIFKLGSMVSWATTSLMCFLFYSIRVMVKPHAWIPPQTIKFKLCSMPNPLTRKIINVFLIAVKPLLRSGNSNGNIGSLWNCESEMPSLQNSAISLAWKIWKLKITSNSQIQII